MANQQTKSYEYITQTVAEPARVAVQTISTVSAARTEMLDPE